MKILAALKHLGMTQSALAEQVGLNRSTICRIIAGRNKPSPECAQRIHKALRGLVGLHELRSDIWGRP